MIPAYSLIAVLAVAAPVAAMAQETAASPLAGAPAPAAGQAQTLYPLAFFAASGANTALDMVQRLPGFSLDTGDAVRGFEGSAGNVLIDGARPVSKTDALDEMLKRIPASQVDHIEIIRGGAPGIDMQGKSILANVVRSKTAGRQIVLVFADNRVNDGRNRIGARLEVNSRIGPGAFEGGLRYGEGVDDGAGDGPHLRLTPDGRVLQRSDIDSHGESHQWVATGAYELPVAGGTLKVNGRIFEDYYRYNELNWFSVPSSFLQSDNDTQNERQTEAGVRYTRPFGARTVVELLGLRQTDDINFNSDFRAPPNLTHFGLIKLTEESIGRGVLKYRASDRLSFEAGAETALNKLDSHTALAKNAVAVALPAASVQVEEKRSEAFAKAVWRPVPQLTLEGGLRYESSDITSTGDVLLEKSLHFAKPRFFATWAPREGTQVRLRYERTVSQLNFDDFVATSSLNTGVVTTGNPDLDPEQAWVSEIAVEQRFWTNGTIALALRHYALSDVIDRAPVFSPTGIFDAPNNIGDGAKDEVGLTLSVPLARLGVKGGQLRGEATWRKTEVTDPTTHDKREISNLKPLEWEAHFTQDLPQWRATWGVDVFGGWRKTYYRFDEISTDKLKSYVVLFGEYKLRPDLGLRLEIDNITSRGFRHILTDYTGPRGANPIATVDDRDIQFGRMIYFRVRKTFS
jgi:outer membrane receptor protein involved in Fe transport